MASQERIKLIQAEAKATERLKILQAEKAKAEKENNTALANQIENNIKKIEKFKDRVSGIKESVEEFKSITESMNLSSRATSELTKNLNIVDKRFKAISSLSMSVDFNVNSDDALIDFTKGGESLGRLQADFEAARESGDRDAMKSIGEQIAATEGFIQKAQRIQSIQQELLNTDPTDKKEIDRLTSELDSATNSLQEFLKSSESKDALESNKDLASLAYDYVDGVQKANKELKITAGLTEGQIAAQKKLTQGAEEMAAKVSTFGNMLSAALKSPFTIVGGILIGLSKVLDVVGKTTREMGGFVGGLTGATTQVSALSVVFPSALESAKGLSSEFGGLSDTSFETQFNTNLLATNLGVSGKEASQLVGQFARLNNGSVDTANNLIASTKELAKQRGLIPSQVMADVAGSAQAFAEYGKAGGTNIAEAAVAAGQLGSNLDGVTKVTNQLLDFENSINQELELGARLGKNINFQEARRLAYQGDIKGSIQAALQQMGGIEGFNRMDIFQKRAAAAALGLQTDELQKMLSNMDKLNKDGSIQVSQFDQMKETLTAVATGPMGSIVKSLGIAIMGLPYLANGLKVLGPLGKLIAAPFKLILSATNGILRGMKFLVVESGKFLLNMVKAAAQKLGFGGSDITGGAKDAFTLAKEKGLSDKQILSGFGGKEAKDMMQVPESITDKAKDSISDKAEDLAEDKLDSVADKISDKADGVAPDESIGGKLTSLASGLTAMGTGQVLKGALNLIPTALGFIAILPGIPGMFLVGKTGISAGKGLLGLAPGLMAMNGTLSGSTSLIAAGIGFSLMTVGLLGMAGVGALGAFAGQGLLGLAPGLLAMTPTLLGSASLIAAGIGFTLMIPGAVGMGLVGALGAFAGAGLVGLSVGLLAMTPTLLGSVALAAAALGFTLMIPGSVGMLLLGAAAPIAAFGIFTLIPALTALGVLMTSGVGALGIIALIGLGVGLGTTLALIGAGAMMFGKGIELAANGLNSFLPTLSTFMESINLKQVGLIGLLSLAFIGLAGSLMLLGTAGLFALPTLLGIAAASAGIAMVAEVFGFAGGESKSEETTALESESISTFEKDVLDKIDNLITAVGKGMQVNLDGRRMNQGLERSTGRSLENNVLVGNK